MNIDEKKRKHIEACIMVDTLDLRVGNVPHAKLPKKFSEVSDYPKEQSSNVPRAVEDTGWSKGVLVGASGKQSLRPRGVKRSGDLFVEGSNAFHYQGHNIVSSNDVTMSAYSMLHATNKKYPLNLGRWRPWEFILGEGIEVTRVDTPIMLKVPEGLQKGAIINALALAGILDGINTSLYVHETVYWDQQAQGVALKAYDKCAEMHKRRKKALPDSPNAAALHELAETTIRFEAVYRKKYFKSHSSFKDRLVCPAVFNPRILAEMFAELIEKYNLKGSLRRRLGRDDLWAIRRPFRDTVAHWQHGMGRADLLQMLDGSERTLKTHRRVIEDEYSIDIFAEPPSEITVPVELGEILRIENFVPVPEAIRTDPALFYQRDMSAEWRSICERRGINGIGAVYLDPNRPDDEGLSVPEEGAADGLY